jgi:hypothetical protein
LIDLLQDSRQALRNLRHSFGSATVATLTLASDIGSATLFRVVNAVLIRPLPFNDPDRLLILWTKIPRQDIHEMRTRYFTFRQWHEQSAAAPSAPLESLILGLNFVTAAGRNELLRSDRVPSLRHLNTESQYRRD